MIDFSTINAQAVEEIRGATIKIEEKLVDPVVNNQEVVQKIEEKKRFVTSENTNKSSYGLGKSEKVYTTANTSSSTSTSSSSTSSTTQNSNPYSSYYGKYGTQTATKVAETPELKAAKKTAKIIEECDKQARKEAYENTAASWNILTLGNLGENTKEVVEKREKKDKRKATGIKFLAIFAKTVISLLEEEREKI